MSHSTLAILVVFNNYFHDLATALFAVSVSAAWLLLNAFDSAPERERVRDVVRKLIRIGYGALIWTLVAGGIRAAAFKRFEYPEAAGDNLIPALIVKHIILFSVVGFGVWVLVALQRRLKGATPGAMIKESG